MLVHAKWTAPRHCPAELPGRFRLLVQPKPSFEGHLVAVDLATLDMTSDLRYLEPAQLPHGLTGFRDGTFDSFADAGFRCSDQVNDLVDVIRHGPSLPIVPRFSGEDASLCSWDCDAIGRVAATDASGEMRGACCGSW